MNEETAAHHWHRLDPWWDTYVKTESPVLTTPPITAIDSRYMADDPMEMDSWWEAYANLGEVLDDYSAGVDVQSIADSWTDFGPWWDAYIEARAADVSELGEVFAESDALWEQRDGPFNADPLSTNPTQRMRTGDPLNPGVEEDWSDWLAQLLQTDSGEFHCALFGEEFTTPPRQVKREAHHPEPSGIDRYADILSLHGSRAISIEVKIGDKNFGKTTHTAALIENQYHADWHHYLLLPEDDLSAVNESFAEEIDLADDGKGVIHSEQSEDVELLYWSDVSRALRTVLLDENKQAPHWSASAYLFCTQIEQERLGFTPKSVIKRLRAEANRIQSFESVSIVIDDLETQVEYLQDVTKDTNE
ncbi:hypothetical protein [Salinibaculum rarum]|uniref:hypothetical protein n=1 Tax=Salinibaculum rarum TaxID=3058903 RepID=UPI00265EA9CF|nr:hypothetical protein [Salinibaculum sp. KK48]